MASGARSCSALYCHNTSNKAVLHRFPNNDSRRTKKWLRNMKRGGSFAKLKPRVLRNSYRVCSIHFEDDQYKTSMRIHLKRGAIPSIFHFLTTSTPAAPNDYAKSYPPRKRRRFGDIETESIRTNAPDIADTFAAERIDTTARSSGTIKTEPNIVENVDRDICIGDIEVYSDIFTIADHYYCPPVTSITETSHTETSHTETSNTETSHTETSHTETSNTETSNTKTSNTETSNTEASNTEASNTEASNPETSNPETSNTEASNPEASNPETSNTEASNIEASNPETSNPETSNTKASNIEASNPEASNPETSNTEASNTETSAFNNINSRTSNSDSENRDVCTSEIGDYQEIGLTSDPATTETSDTVGTRSSSTGNRQTITVDNVNHDICTLKMATYQDSTTSTKYVPLIFIRNSTKLDVKATQTLKDNSVADGKKHHELYNRINALKAVLKRRDSKIKQLEEELNLERKKKFNLPSNFNEPQEILFKNILDNNQKSVYCKRYSSDILKFSLRLHTYSSKAYDFLREMLILPNRETIRLQTKINLVEN